MVSSREILALAAILAVTTPGLRAQVISSDPSSSSPATASVYIVPQSRAFVTGSRGVVITGVQAAVSILDQASTTTLDIAIRNNGRRREEAQVLVPVPDGAVLRGFSFEGAAKEPTARLLPKEEARRIYDAIVARTKDPALLEFVGLNLIRSSVFPVEPGTAQKVRLTWEVLLPADGSRVDYVLPRTEAVTYSVPWKVSVKIRSKTPISTVYSPSHAIETTRTSDTAVTVKTAATTSREPGSFRLSYLRKTDGVTASLFAYPDPKIGGGYFLLLAGLPPSTELATEAKKIRREVTLVIDRSGSMHGEKIEQVREAALQIIAGLEEGETFNILPYSNAVDMFSPQPVVKTAETEKQAREYLKAIRTFSGTNIHDALVEALRQKPTEGALPLVLFLTDGLPTVGNTSEVAIREVASKANPYNRRIFSFGVGVDVNTPLLDKIATETRAVATFVLPKEDVEVKVGGVFRRLQGPVLATPNLDLLGPGGAVVTTRVQDVLPTQIPDLFDGDQLVVLGKYKGDDPLAFRLAGNYRGTQRTFQFALSLDKATTRHAFVPRLWASRQIAVLVAAIRDLGAGSSPFVTGPTPADPRMKELVDEIVRLSTEFGILTEYTAFLAEEGTDLTRFGVNNDRAFDYYSSRALRVRSGLGSFNQEANGVWMRNQKRLNFANRYYDAGMNAVAISNVQQVNDLAFYHRKGYWVDSRLANDTTDASKAQQIVQYGTPEFRDLLLKLVSSNRQGSVALAGDVLLQVDGKPVLVKGPASAPAPDAPQVEK